MRHLIFKIKEERFAIDIMRIVEILNPLEIHRIPDLPDFIEGVINLRGNIIPVVNMRKRFEINEPSEKSRIVIIRFDNEVIGLMVDDVTEIKDIEAMKISKPSRLFRGFKAKFIKGIAHIDEGDVIIIMDIDRVLTTEEIIKIKETSKQIKKRVKDGK